MTKPNHIDIPQSVQDLYGDQDEMAARLEMERRDAERFDPEAPQPEPQPKPKRGRAKAEPEAQRWAVQEAPASCCLKWSIGGLEIMYTMRDTDDDKLFARVGRILPRIEHKLEMQRQERARRQAEKAAASSNGHTPTPATPSQPPQEPVEDHTEHWCDYHDQPLRKFSKDGRSWYTHYDDESGKWCRGK